MLVLLCALGASAAFIPPAVPPLSRRSFTRAALVGLPAITLPPRAAHAGIFGGNGDAGPQGALRDLQRRRQRLEELAEQLRAGKLKGDKADDAVVVLQTLTVQLAGTVELLGKATAAMPLLDPSERVRADELALRFADELDNIRKGCREQSAKSQLASSDAAGKALEEYLALVAASKYSLPALEQPLAYSKDPNAFAAQYYGIFSCEGQGLERLPGSNSCKSPTKNGGAGATQNPFPEWSRQKKFQGSESGDTDLLTGKSLR